MIIKKIFPKISKFLILSILIGLTACITCPSKKNYTISQVGKFPEFTLGDYKGKTSIDKLADYGNFGVGTFDSLDGELVINDGIFYQITSDGVVKIAKKSQTVPYATVNFFNSENAVFLEGPLNFNDLTKTLDRVRTDLNKVYAFKISGNFSYLKLRSPKIQTFPYPKLKDIINKQPSFEHKNIDGTLIGYYSPTKFNNILIPEYHFHFISNDKKVGGHVLELDLSGAKLQIDQIDLEKINLIAD